MGYTNHNADAWNAMTEISSADGRSQFTRSFSHEDFIQAKQGRLRVSLTSAKPVPESWFPPLRGLKILGLASGGGQQGPIFAAHGANVTILDVSRRQIESERYVAEREGYSIETVERDMTRPLPFDNQVFDLIFHPVSNCYIEKLQPVWAECSRVIKPGGVIMMGYVKEEQMMFAPDFHKDKELIASRRVPFNPLTDMIIRHEPFVFSHTLTEQIGGLIRAGFTITDLYEDGDGGGIFDQFMNSYVAVRAVKMLV